jgi:hypothetical protein
VEVLGIKTEALRLVARDSRHLANGEQYMRNYRNHQNLEKCKTAELM